MKNNTVQKRFLTVVCEYSVRLDIWQLTTKQQKELIENLYTLKDIETIQQLESKDSDNFNNTVDKDFVQSSQQFVYYDCQ